MISAPFWPYPSVPAGLTLMAFFNSNLEAPTPTQAEPFASRGADRNAKVASVRT